MAKKPFTFENNFSKVITKVQEKPYSVMNILGSTLTKEIRANIRSSSSSRRGLLSKGLGFWARKKEKDLQIGFKVSIGALGKPSFPGIVGLFMSKKEEDPIMPVILKNKELILETIAKSLDEIRSER